jgi:ferrochelatase
MSGATPPIGVLVMAHGTPGTSGEIEPFYTRIRRGHPPTQEQLEDLCSRYERIGGVSPLADVTRAQVAGLAARLEAASPGRYLLAYGAKHAAPFLEASACTLADAGCDQIVGLVLTPHGSTLGSGEYLSRAAAALAAHPRRPQFCPIDHWYDAPGFAALVGTRIADALGRLPASAARQAVVVFTAHSLPERVLAQGDRYPEELAESAALAAQSAGLAPDGWRVAWQSAGRTAEPWIGPALLDVIPELAERGAGAAVVCPIGFVSDHLEVLFDLDIEAADAASEVGLPFTRTTSLNDDPAFLEMLAGVVATAPLVAA